MINKYTAFTYCLLLIHLVISCSREDTMFLDPPLEAAIEADLREIQVGDTVRFSDISAGLPSQWKWIFEGGSPGESVVHSPIVVYDTAGTYPVTLEVRRGDKVSSITIPDFIDVGYRALAADFTTDTTTVNLGEQVQFTDLSVGFPASWQWEFYAANGTVVTSEEQHPEMTFSKPGIYSVKLTVSHPGGEGMVVKEEYLTVLSANPPEAEFMANSTGVAAGGSITFENKTTGDVTGWTWTFEGGSPATSTELNPTVAYHTPGRYRVVLEAYDEISTSTKTREGFVLVVPADGLAAYYPLDGDGNDIGPMAQHASIIGDVAFADASRSDVGAAAQFEGSGLLLVADDPAFNFGTNDFTISCWLNTSNTNRMMIWAESGANGARDNQTWLRLNDNAQRQIRFAVEDGSGGTIQNSDHTVSDGQWHHVVCVREGRVSRVYVDGTLIKEGTAPVVKDVSNSQDFKIGAQETDGGGTYSNYFNGMIDDFLVYDRALSEQEISNLFDLQ
ncbi:LamG-like jellyroll fold domain-containing protein [Parapedobacter tibetensis]|uniref:LamG-like jellyroll fold domain-containing protein n=1 Tax=Parapedobacter tibetensis TaxID=2972951 RepID=UPI00214DACB6|nr:LamG-like jellyroll fold domain-containing protein [Parapedobacter tibetensis]